MAEVKIIEYSDVANGQHYRRKVKVAAGEDDKGKPIIADEWEYVQAFQFHGDPGFTVRQPEHMDRDGGLIPLMVSGGGNGDYIVKDLLDGRLSAVRQNDFNAQYERISVAKLPRPLKEKAAESESVDAEG